MEKNRVCPRLKGILVFIVLYALSFVLGFALQLSISVDPPFQQIERGTPFLIRYVIFDYEGEEKNLTVSLDTQAAFSGNFDEFLASVIDHAIKPFQELGSIDRELEDGAVSGGIICSSALVGTHELEVLVFEKDRLVKSESLVITVTENHRLSQALNARWEKKKKPEHFGLSFLSENAVFYNEQYSFSMIAVEKVSASETLKLSGFYYYTPALSQAKALRYAAYLTETLGGETYALKMADVVVNPNPLLEEQAKVKVYHPYLRWIDASGKEIEDLSYEDEYETVLYQKPTDSSFFQADPIVLKEWEASPALQTGEIGTVRFSIESRSLFFGSTFKMISMPSAQTSLTLRRSWITESEGIRRIDRTTHYEYDFLPESAATYTLTIEPFAYTVTRTGETRVFQTDPLTIVVTQRLEDKPFTGILNPLKPLRENSARVKNKQEFEKGLLYALEENWEEATRVFSRLAEEEPLSDDIWYNLGWVAFSSDQVGLSQLCFYRAFTIVETEDTQYNIRFIETAKGLSGRPLAKVKRIDGLAHRWLGVGGVVCLALFSFSITLRLRRLSVFKRRREAEHPEKHRRLSRALLAFIALICLAFCAANLLREYAFERQAVVLFESPAYGGPAFDYPAIGTIAPGNVGKCLAQRDGFSYMEYLAPWAIDAPFSGDVTSAVRYWVPSENLEVILSTLFTE